MVSRIIRYCLKNPRLRSMARRVYHAYIKDTMVDRSVETNIGETTPLYVRRSELEDVRLNLIVPALSAQHVFGGIATALSFFSEIGRGCENLRIILSDESDFTSENNEKYSGWKICRLSESDLAGKIIVPAGSRQGRLAVARRDIFIVTAWWTSFVAARIREAQAQFYGFSSPVPYIYLVQDFEPGFYPWSSRYALAESTYHVGEDCLAVFNSKILSDFFSSKGYQFKNRWFFDPRLHEDLRSALVANKKRERQRKVIVYGRPGVARNGFELIIMALREWCRQNPDAGRWQFVSAGENHPDLELGNGAVLRSLGKLTIEEYAGVLLDSYAGLSIMISPHPSYPPLEMAAFGLRVITNKYDSKDLSELSPNIISVDQTSPRSIADALDAVLSGYESDPAACHVESAWLKGYVAGNHPFEKILEPLRAAMGIESGTA